MELSLQSQGQQSMSIMTFGLREECSRVCDVVNIDMEMQHGHRRQFTLFAIPIICEPLTCQHIRISSSTFQGLH